MSASFRFPSIADYAVAYREQGRSPVDIAQRVLAATSRGDERDPPMRFFIAQSRDDLLEQARASADRFARGKALSPFDGVPVAVKDEIDQRGYCTTVGTTFIGQQAAAADATVVARLREAGALLIGKANMHEIGLGVTGINPHHGPARNPYNPAHITGGSSSGCGATVGAGLCPVAIGADGGGSIRIPASLCGVTGIKPTFGRVSEIGAAPLCWSVAHIGPLAASVADAAAALSLIAGPDPADPNTLGQPELDLAGVASGVEGLRIGWCPSWCDAADEVVLGACRRAVEGLVDAGAQLHEVTIDYLELVRPVQYITIGVEMAASQYENRREHKQDYAADTRMLLEMASQMPAVDYVRAQRMRSMIAAAFQAALAQVDVLITPSTASTAPPLPKEALKAGLSDDAVLEALTAFSFAANLTGQPASSQPVGYDGAGMPIGLQIIGKHWDEATVLRAAHAVEKQVTAQAPQVYCAPLYGKSL